MARRRQLTASERELPLFVPGWEDSTLGNVLGRPTILPTPSFALKAILGSELAETLVLQSDRVVPARLEADGFEFESPVLVDALRSVLEPTG